MRGGIYAVAMGLLSGLALEANGVSLRTAVSNELSESASAAVAVAPAAGGLAFKVLSGLAAPVAGLVMQKAMAEMGMGQFSEVLDGIARIEGQLESMSFQMEELKTLIVEQNFINAMGQAELAVNSIKNKAGDVRRWRHNSLEPNSASNVALAGELELALLDMATFTVHPTTGALGAYMRFKSTSMGSVSDLAGYFEELDRLRAYFINMIALAYATVEAIQEYVVLMTAQCKANGGYLLQLEAEAEDANSNEAGANNNEAGAVSGLISFEGRSSNACRGGYNGEGGPADSNFLSYFTIKYASSLSACQNLCRYDAACKGIEWNGKTRCEVWKRTVVTYKPSSGYWCYKKVVLASPTPYPTPPPVEPTATCAFRELSSATLREAFKQASGLAVKMYELGVPLMEARKSPENYFLHAKGQNYALLAAPPLSSGQTFSGYFGTNTGTRVSSKLQTLAAGFSSSNFGGKTLQQVMDAKRIPTAYFNQNTWACKSVALGQWSKRIELTVEIDRIVLNSYLRTSIPYRYFGEYDSASCNSALDSYKRQAGTDYTVSGGSLAGGIFIGAHPVRCGDASLCRHDEIVKFIFINTRVFGRFYTMNLSGDDCSRLQSKYGTTSKQYRYCGTRKDAMGRAALLSYDAVRDYFDA